MTPPNIMDAFTAVLCLGLIISGGVCVFHSKSAARRSVSVPCFSMQVFLTVFLALQAAKYSQQLGSSPMFQTLFMLLGTCAGVVSLIVAYRRSLRNSSLDGEDRI